MAGQQHLQRSKDYVVDEFYTYYEDVEAELSHYDFSGLHVYLPCDSEESNFFKYFRDNFSKLKIKKLVATSLSKVKITIHEDGSITKESLKRGEFQENAEEFYNCDIVVTNPPFSLFRKFYQYVAGKKFILIAPLISISYKSIAADFFIYNTIRLGYNKVTKFYNPEGKYKNVGCLWLTNLEVHKVLDFEPTATYSPEKYPRFNMYDAINCKSYLDIPKDYDGVIGVPVSFVFFWNRDKWAFVHCESVRIKEKHVLTGNNLLFMGTGLVSGRNLLYGKESKLSFTRFFIQRMDVFKRNEKARLQNLNLLYTNPNECII